MFQNFIISELIFFCVFVKLFLSKGGFNLTCPTSKWTKQGVDIMQIFRIFMVAICGASSVSTFGSLLKTKGVNYAKNSRSGVTWTPR